MERHEYEPCGHEGRHGYTLRGETEYEMCERCRRGPESHDPLYGSDSGPMDLPDVSGCECGKPIGHS